MKNQKFPQARTWWSSAGLALALGLATAAFAGTITPAQEAKVKVGMGMDEVRQALGAPTTVMRVRYSPGPTWTYQYETGGRLKHYEVDFDAAGRVMWIEHHDLPTGASGG